MKLWQIIIIRENNRIDLLKLIREIFVDSTIFFMISKLSKAKKDKYNFVQMTKGALKKYVRLKLMFLAFSLFV